MLAKKFSLDELRESLNAMLTSNIHTEISTMYGGSPNPLSYSCTPSTGVSSGANMGSVLKNDFNYTTADWANYNYQTVKSNIIYSKPVILSGSNSSSGHMWVALTDIKPLQLPMKIAIV